MNNTQCPDDLMIIGGGINGTGIAADAAGRALNVTLCEMNDLGSATSSNSSKLIHGGLRYLEYYDFRLVREALAEREVLLKKAPHIIHPIRIRLPHRSHLRPAWLIRAGLFLYDHLSRRTLLKGSHGLRFDSSDPLEPFIERGFEFSDGWVDDARLVIVNAMAARQKGACIKPRTRCIKAQRKGALWEVTLRDQLTGAEQTQYARVLVNAAGPWVSQLFNDVLPTPAATAIRLVKGSHIIVPRLHEQPYSYMLQNEDNRIVFVIPYEGVFSLIGTTDVEFSGDPATASIDAEEIDYLITLCNQYFKQKITRGDIVKTFSGVRPLLDNESDAAQAVTRDYRFVLDSPVGQAPLLSVFGGKITTYRKLAESAVDSLSHLFPHAGPRWTADAVLPGGNFTHCEELQRALQILYPWLPESALRRFTRSYGSLTHQMLGNAQRLEEMGKHFGADLYQQEVDYLVEHEWACTADDILWRRSKLGLFLNPEQQHLLAQYLAHIQHPSNH